MLPVPSDGPVPGFVAIVRFRSDAVPELMARLRDAVALLAQQGGFVHARVSRAIDDGALIVVELGWDTVGSYRRALSSYDVKVQVVPLISAAIDEPTAFEVLHAHDDSGVVDASGALAADADTVSLGGASTAYAPPAPS